MNNSFSIVTINKNNCEGLKKTIKSVSAQIYSGKYEHIIIDGNSTDSSKSIIFKNKKNFSFFQSKNDLGIYNAMNLGLKQSFNTWVIFLNSGDIFYNKYVLKKLNEIVSKKYDIFYGNIIQKIKNKNVIRYAKENTELFKYILQNQIFHQACIIKTKMHKKNFYDEKLKIFSDYKFLYNCFKKNIRFKKINLIISIVLSNGI